MRSSGSLVSALAWALGPLAVSGNEIYRTSLFPEQHHHVPISTFGYDALNGPLNWYGLNTSANGLCDTGNHQSPIDILDSLIGKSVMQTKGSSIKVDIPTMEHAEFENLGSTVEVPAKGMLVDPTDGKKFNFVQFHYHTPAEHRINGEYMVMEQHLVFQAADEELAVIGVLLDIDDSTTEPLSKSVLSNVEKISEPGSTTEIGPLDFSSLIKHFNSNEVYRYNGSLTSPPCSEGLRWMVSASPVPVDMKTFKATRKVLKYNSRFTQDNPGMPNLLEKVSNQLSTGSNSQQTKPNGAVAIIREGGVQTVVAAGVVALIGAAVFGVV